MQSEGAVCKKEITERTGLWTLPWTLNKEKKCHILVAGRAPA